MDDQEEIDQLYREAIHALRVKVEVEGVELEEALSDVITSHTLGLAQIADLEDKARAKYGSKAKPLLSNERSVPSS